MKRRLIPLVVLAFAVFLAPFAVRAAGSQQVARLWKGRTLAARADEYEKYLITSGIAKIRATPGNLGVQLLRRADGGQVEFVVISFWESLEAVKTFAGADYQKAVILERDREYLIEVEPNVLHFEVALQEPGKGGR